MIRMVLIFLVAFLAFANPVRAEEIESPHSNSTADLIGDFTRSMSRVYVSSEMCKHIESLHFGAYSGVIKNYLDSYYNQNIPYWVLPEVNTRIQNRDQCLARLGEDLTDYQLASRHFSEIYTSAPTPPVLTLNMLTEDNSGTTAPVATPGVSVVRKPASGTDKTLGGNAGSISY